MFHVAGKLLESPNVGDITPQVHSPLPAMPTGVIKLRSS